MPSPNISQASNELVGMTATSATNIWAVGDATILYNGATQTLIEHWDGTSWSIVPSPTIASNAFDLSGIAAVPGTNELWAVGGYLESNDAAVTLIEHWNGSQWSIVPSPNIGLVFNQLNSVSALSSTNIWSVGYYQNLSNGNFRPLVEHWDGTKWKVVRISYPTGKSYFLKSIAKVPGTSQLWAVGSYDQRPGFPISFTYTERYC